MDATEALIAIELLIGKGELIPVGDEMMGKIEQIIYSTRQQAYNEGWWAHQDRGEVVY